MTTTTSRLTESDLHQLARRRVGMKMGWLLHAAVFVLVNAGLWGIDAMHGGVRWAHWPLMGWGLGLTIHGVVVALVLAGHDRLRRLIEQEADRLRARQ